MIPDGTYTAVVDRIEEGIATLELEAEDDLYALDIEAAELPAEARTADAVLEVTVADAALADVTYEADETVDRASEAQRRFDRLSKRPPRDGE
ncbi:MULTISPECIES: DUF3006 domain-containing protein [unclassified Haloarcula]|uniref:DUF3006 domain-containing protein n=1 Tax=unclassified Haloarcula TaxID=2624677 RepID=UPI000EF159FA|nr:MULTISPECIES: DUF3006 domain-containing protein [unclassified Haloarcula]RLM48095.1 DUF3006 domain-containing protein [Haloarcula sp. Atlit-47R]RLM96494.1 DUF3006 domain-containing protein [Haloarcula sp. Atlit-7R]